MCDANNWHHMNNYACLTKMVGEWASDKSKSYGDGERWVDEWVAYIVHIYLQ